MAGELARRLAKGTLILFVANGFMGVSGLLTSILLARLLTTAELGAWYTLMQGIVVPSLLLARLGVDVGVQKMIGVAQAEGDGGRLRRTLLAAVLASSVGTAAVLVGLTLLWGPLTSRIFTEPALALLLPAALALVVGNASEQVTSAILRSLGAVAQSALLLGVPRQLTVLGVLCVVWGLGGGLSLERWVGLNVVAFGLTTLLSAGALLWRMRALPPSPGVVATTREMVRLSVPMMVHGGAAVVLGGSDIWVLSAWRPSDEVGIYGAVTRLSGAMAFMLGVVNMILPPMVARLYAEGKKAEMEALLRKAAGWGAWVAVPTTLVLTLGGAELLAVVYREEFSRGYAALAMLAVTQCINTLSGSPGYVMQMTGSHRLLTLLTAATALVNLGGNLLLVPRWGMEGAAGVTAVALLAQNVIMVVYVRRRLGIWTHVDVRTLWPPVQWRRQT